jgi:O-antigen biosynthesis protein
MKSPSLRQTILNKFIRYSFFLKIKKLLIKFKLFDYFYQINLIGMLSILLAREKLSSIIDFMFTVLAHGLDYVKSQHLSINYYQKWIKNNEHYQSKHSKKTINNFKYTPVYSIIMAIVNNNTAWLNEAIDSINRQLYPDWELCVYVHASSLPAIRDCLAKWGAAPNPQIKIMTGREELSWARAYSCALQQARGEFIAFMSEADTISPDALYEVTKLLNLYPEAEFIYSDEDKIQEDSIRFDPFFKPDWSPDLCLSMMYTGNLAIYRRSTVERLGGLREDYGPAFTYDLVLRLMEKIDPAQIYHIPRILYHARSSPAAWNQLPAGEAMHEMAKLALNDYRLRNDLPGSVTDGQVPGSYRFQRFSPDSLQVSIIIPFRDKVDLLEKCIVNILTKTDYKNYEIILINNRSKEKDTLAFLEKIADHPAIRIYSYDHDFNFSAINNFAVAQSAADYLVFLNNDTEVIAPEWLTAMMEHMTRKEVGAVGAKLIYYDGTIQHAGVIMGITQICGHAFRRFPADHPGYFGQLQVVRNCSAVTGACMLVRKEIFQAVGGFDADHLPVGYNDIDLCLKMLHAGYLIVWTPYALLYHREYSSRGDDRDVQDKTREHYQRVIDELAFIEHKWACYIEHDPYYNPNLTRLFENYGF